MGSYLEEIAAFAKPDGNLPVAFEELIEEVFAAVLRPAEPISLADGGESSAE